MKASLIALSCILIGAVACTAPQGRKISASGTSSGLAPVAEGPGDAAMETSVPATQEAAVTEADKGKVVSVVNQGKITVTLEAAREDGYAWRLAEIPNSSVLKLVSEDYTPPASGQGRGEAKWVFRAMGPGEVKVKMWYGNLRESSLGGNPGFDFVASISDQAKTEKKPTTTTTKKPVKKA